MSARAGQISRPQAPNQRADARRNREAILDAAITCLGRDPDTSVAAIAREARVGRVTLYGHFPTRADLVDAALVAALEQGDAALTGVDLSGDPQRALERLIESSWQLVERSRALLVAAQKTLPPGRIRALHAKPAERVLGLLIRGQAEGVFRTDLPATWLVGTLHSVMHGAAEEVNAGRVASADAAHYITATVLPAFSAAARG
ncbi:TetR/AcrR family transcriptional regulator [Nocardia puris]|uniref:TetR family transcriptional regulator n=1 Tax=Nocardia puris TaxID=208602 RepID=A0A366D6B6_9NOCA|nr:TetR/AcrR family transcriptional regulator [Nocardia puris]MBF6212349.1 TetR/AcrR family transcriptional regulator [Nocardia puris]MBF6366596.1 TetR/AcrR family transcriptional regulator [Nocardia puris]MBF6460938.1 TetR/AcrR family transcriptional regulator [Nocardia puris]RBO85583.1 TetR family transcriptional regulator [Nocardia puris]